MKLYRAVPILLFSEHKYKHPYTESIYFENGYIAKSHHSAKNWKSNTLASKIKNDGKYFFFFPEHAIRLGRKMFYRESILKIMEYDFPEEIIFKLVGNGYYQEGAAIRSIPETIIEYQDIPGEIINAKELKEIKLTMLKESLKEINNRIQTIKEFKAYHNLTDEALFQMLTKEDKMIFGNNYIKYYLNEKIDLFRAPDSTIRSWTIDTNFNNSYFLDSTFNKNKKYLKDNDLKLHLTEAAENARINFNVDGIMRGDIEKAKSLLKKYHQKFPY